MGLSTERYSFGPSPSPGLGAGWASSSTGASMQGDAGDGSSGLGDMEEGRSVTSGHSLVNEIGTMVTLTLTLTLTLT